MITYLIIDYILSFTMCVIAHNPNIFAIIEEEMKRKYPNKTYKDFKRRTLIESFLPFYFIFTTFVLFYKLITNKLK